MGALRAGLHVISRAHEHPSLAMSDFRWLDNEEAPEESAEGSLRLPGMPSQRRAIRGVRRPLVRISKTDDFIGAVEGVWEPVGSTGDRPPAGGTADPVNGGFVEQASSVPRPFAEAEATQRQQQWESVRPAVQCSCLEHLADMDSLRAGLRTGLKVAMEEALAAAQPCCPLCQAEDMEQVAPADVLYVGTEYCFELAAPR